MHKRAPSGPTRLSFRRSVRLRVGVCRFFPLFLLAAVVAPGISHAAGFDPVGAAKAQSPAPFLGAVRELDGESRDKNHQLPKREKLDAPYGDVPFVVHVPFQIPYEGGVARVHTNVTFKFESAAHAKVWGDRFIVSRSNGLYRLDGKKLADKSVFYDWRGYSDAKDWKPLPFFADSPVVPTWSARFENSIRIARESEAHVPFAEIKDDGKPGTLSAGPSFVLSPAEPGWYVFWFSIEEEGWPRDPLCDVVLPKFSVDVLVARGERRAEREELEYMFGKNKPRPKDMREDKFFVPLSFEIPVKVIRDGWVFDHAVVRTDDKRIEAKEPKIDSFRTEFAPVTTAGLTTELRMGSTVWSEEWRGPGGKINRAEILVKDTYAWQLKFPQIIPDHSFSTVEIGGQHERYTNEAHAIFKGSEKPGENFYTLALCGWEPAFVERGPFAWVLNEEEKTTLKNNESPGLYIDYNCRTETGSLSTDEEKDSRDYFLKTYGKEAENFFFFDHRGRAIQKKGAKPFLFQVHAVPPNVRHRVTENGGAYPLLAFRAGPWNVLGFYRRAKDGREGTGGPPTGGEVKVVPDADPFFTWLREYSDLLNEKKKVVDDQMKKARSIQVPLRLAIESNKRLIAMVKLGWTRSAGERALDALFGGEEPIDAETKAQILVFAREQAARIHTYQDELQAASAAGTKALEDVIAKITAVEDKHRDRHKQILDYKKAARLNYEKFPLQFAAESGDHQALRRAIEQVDPLAASAETRLLQADLLLKDHDMVGALYAARSAVAVERENPEALKALKEIECSFLKTAIAKTQGEVAAARAAFFKYLKERGFSEEDKGNNQVGDAVNLPWAGDVADMPWYKQLYVSMSTLDTETAWAIFSTGAVGSLMAINGKVADKAATLDSVEKEMASAYVGLNAILRLRLRDVQLADIAKLDVEEMRVALQPKYITGRAYNADEAAQLREAMAQAMKLLPDVRALFKDDPGELEKALTAAYNIPDVEETWVEWFGDLTSAKNLLPMLLPFAVARVGGRLVGVGYWGASEIAFVAEAAEAGHVMYGTEAVLQLVGMQRVLNGIGASPLGRFLAKDLERFQQYQQSLGLLDKGIWGTGKIMGVMVFQVVSLHLAEKYGGKKAALIAEAVLIFGNDFDVLIKFLNQTGLPPQQVARILGKHIVPALQANVKSITAVQVGMEELEKILEHARSGKPIKPQELAALELNFGENWRTAIPTGDAAHDASMLLTAGKEGMSEGVDNGALAEAKKLAERIAKEEQELKEILAQIEKRKALLEAAEQKTTAAKPLDSIGVREGLTPRAPDMPPVPKGYPVGPRPRFKSLTARANTAMQSGDFNTAIKLYKDAIELVESGAVTEANEFSLERLAMKLEDAINARATQKLTPKPEAPAMLAVIDETEATAARAAKGKPYIKKGKMGDIFEVDGNPNLLVKELGTGMTDPLREAEAEAVHQALARMIGMEVPGMHISVIRDAEGKVVKASFVMRKVEGREMMTLDAGDLFMLREEYSRHRALAVLIGDKDRHLGNYIVTKDGRLIAIDAGFGDPTGSKARRAAMVLDDPHFLTGQDGLDHFVARIAKGERGGPANDLAIRRQLIAEEMMTYQAAKPTVDSLTDLVFNKPRELRTRLKEALGPIYGHDEALLLKKVEETMETLRARGAKLDETMRTLNNRTAVPLEAPVLQTWWLPSRERRIVPFLAGAFEFRLPLAA